MSSENSAPQNEFHAKIHRIRNLLDQFGLNAVLLRRVSNFAWATCGGASYINMADSEGVASLLVTPTKCYLLTNNIEAPRLEKEEKLANQGWEFLISPWYSDKGILEKVTQGMKLGVDGALPGAIDLSKELAWLRAQLTPEEGQRLRNLGNLCAQAMKQAAEAIRPGMTEYQLAGLLAQAVESRGVQVTVNLIATDERVSAFRHPLPTQKPLRNYAMLVLCGRKWGLVCSLTRLIHFGAIGDDLLRKMDAVAKVDATMIASTRPGSTMGDVIQKAQAAYLDTGFPDEWQLHHQGGIVGYEPREITAMPNSPQPIQIGQSYAWNPSITGVKSEDTILVGENENEIVTNIEGWPTIEVNIEKQTIKRPDILRRE